jgi:hypothetical protein
MLDMVVLVMAAMLVAMAMPAFADAGRVPHAGSCGNGSDQVHAAQEDPVRPGASEAGLDNLACNGLPPGP